MAQHLRHRIARDDYAQVAEWLRKIAEELPMKLQHTFPTTRFADEHAPALGAIDRSVIDRHDKVAEIVDRHLTAMHAEIEELDPHPHMLNIDGAGDAAEIARQVMTALVDRLRAFAVAGRNEIRLEQESRASAGVPMDLLREKIHRALNGRNRAAPWKISDLAADLDRGLPADMADSLRRYALERLVAEET